MFINEEKKEPPCGAVKCKKQKQKININKNRSFDTVDKNKQAKLNKKIKEMIKCRSNEKWAQMQKEKINQTGQV